MPQQIANRTLPSEAAMQKPRTKKALTRRRATLACEECHTRKRRCDGALPACGGCVRRRSECVYAAEVEAKEWYHRMIQSLQSRLAELENADELTRIASKVSCSPRPHQVNIVSESIENMKHGNLERLMEPIERVLDHEQVSCISNTSPRTSGDPEQCACGCEAAYFAMRPVNLPLRWRADALIAVYFARPARIIPILHQDTFMRQYERLRQFDGARDTSSVPDCVGFCKQKSRAVLFPATIYAVCALGALFESPSVEKNASNAAMFFRQIENMNLFDLLGDEIGIEMVQLGLLMTLYLQSTEKASRCWGVCGLTIRMAQAMGLHLESVESRNEADSLAAKQRLETRVWVWHACVLLETDISMSFGQKAMVPFFQYEPHYLEAADSNHSGCLSNTLLPQSGNDPRLKSYFSEKMTLYGIMRKFLLRERLDTPSIGTALDTTSRAQELLRFDTRIMTWHDRLPKYLKHDNSADSTQLNLSSVNQSTFLGVTLDIVALARRLHCRFLYARQLILRPALELLCMKQRSKVANSAENLSLEMKIKDSLLADVAWQCIESAHELVNFIHAGIQYYDFTCWWDNIKYLYTSGTTLLMGRLSDDSRGKESLETSWERCLLHLARYKEVSSVADESARLLQRRGETLLFGVHQPKRAKFRQTGFDNQILCFDEAPLPTASSQECIPGRDELPIWPGPSNIVGDEIYIDPDFNAWSALASEICHTDPALDHSNSLLSQFDPFIYQLDNLE